MISYKYKLYRTDKTKHLDMMLSEACFVWNHALSLQKRYYSLHKKYIPLGVMQHHQAKRVKRNLLGAQTVQEIIERLDIAYKRFFEHLATLCNLLWGAKIQLNSGLADMFALSIIGSMFNGGGFGSPSPSADFLKQKLEEDENKEKEQIFAIPAK